MSTTVVNTCESVRRTNGCYPLTLQVDIGNLEEVNTCGIVAIITEIGYIDQGSTSWDDDGILGSSRSWVIWNSVPGSIVGIRRIPIIIHTLMLLV